MEKKKIIKEPWQMSRTEYLKSVKYKPGGRTEEDKARSAFIDEYREYLRKTKPEYGCIAASNLMIRPLWQLHRELVEYAVVAGKPVPQEVLREYKFA